MSGRLIYVMGPSGAGKDSVLSRLRERLAGNAHIHWARRTITRAAAAGGEDHEAVTPDVFDALQAQGVFAMAWRAHGLRYGVRREQLKWLDLGEWVFVNGSREYLATALALYPSVTPVHVTATSATLLRRLTARNRETLDQVRSRVERAAAFTPPPGTLEIQNDWTLEDACSRLLKALQAREGSPFPPALSR
jgi:ribose 1,5-bisphosphokinase